MVREHGGLCIADEVQTGFGRTGEHFWGFQNWGVVPDMVTMAKSIGNGLPLAAVTTRMDVAKALTARLHLNTFGGNPISCAAGLAVLDVIDAEGLQAQREGTGRPPQAGPRGAGQPASDRRRRARHGPDARRRAGLEPRHPRAVEAGGDRGARGREGNGTAPRPGRTRRECAPHQAAARASPRSTSSTRSRCSTGHSPARKAGLPRERFGPHSWRWRWPWRQPLPPEAQETVSQVKLGPQDFRGRHISLSGEVIEVRALSPRSERGSLPAGGRLRPVRHPGADRPAAHLRRPLQGDGAPLARAAERRLAAARRSRSRRRGKPDARVAAIVAVLGIGGAISALTMYTRARRDERHMHLGPPMWLIPTTGTEKPEGVTGPNVRFNYHLQYIQEERSDTLDQRETPAARRARGGGRHRGCRLRLALRAAPGRPGQRPRSSSCHRTWRRRLRRRSIPRDIPMTRCGWESRLRRRRRPRRHRARSRWSRPGARRRTGAGTEPPGLDPARADQCAEGHRAHPGGPGHDSQAEASAAASATTGSTTATHRRRRTTTGATAGAPPTQWKRRVTLRRRRLGMTWRHCARRQPRT